MTRALALHGLQTIRRKLFAVGCNDRARDHQALVNEADAARRAVKSNADALNRIRLVQAEEALARWHEWTAGGLLP